MSDAPRVSSLRCRLVEIFQLQAVLRMFGFVRSKLSYIYRVNDYYSNMAMNIHKC